MGQSRTLKNCFGLRGTVYALAVSTLLLLVGCGGGDGSGSSGGSPNGVRVLHAAIDAAPVDVRLEGRASPLSQGNRFGVANYYQAAPSGAQSLVLVRSASNDVVSVGQAAVAPESKISVLVFDGAGGGLQSTVLYDQFPRTFQGALVRVVHGISGVTTVRVVATSGNGVSVVGSAPLGGASEYLAVAPGLVTLNSMRGADSRQVNSAVVPVEEGRAYTVLLAGELGYYVKSVLYSDN
jgi:hypothetical protein